MALKNIPFNEKYIHLIKNGGEEKTDEFKKINPQQLIPVLTVNQDNINQSLAILEYLEECYPTPSLFPKDIMLKAQVRALAYSICCDIHPLNNLRVLQYLQTNLKIDESKKDEWYCHWIQIGFQAIEEQLTRLDLNGPYCFGSQITLADICLIPQAYNAIRFNCHFEQHKKLYSIYQNCMEISAFKLAAPEQQSDFESI